jgi:hypothetical protein
VPASLLLRRIFRASTLGAFAIVLGSPHALSAASAASNQTIFVTTAPLAVNLADLGTKTGSPIAVQTGTLNVALADVGGGAPIAVQTGMLAVALAAAGSTPGSLAVRTAPLTITLAGDGSPNSPLFLTTPQLNVNVTSSQ